DLALMGRATPRLRRLRVGDRDITPDSAGRIVARVHLPAPARGAEWPLHIEVESDRGQRLDFRRGLRPPDRVALLVGIAEGTVGYVIPSSGGAAGGNSGLHASGHVALYARGRIQGRYLIEGGLDLDSSAIGDWRDLFRGDPTRSFRALDP